MSIKTYPINSDSGSKLDKSYTEYYKDKIFKSLGVPLEYINPGLTVDINPDLTIEIYPDLIIDMEADYISEDIPY